MGWGTPHRKERALGRTWNICGVGRLLKVMVLIAIVSELKRPRNWLITVVCRSAFAHGRV